MSRSRFKLGWLLVFLGLFASIPAFCWRWRFEKHPSPVQITLDLSNVRACADAWALRPERLLAEMRRAGTSGLLLDMSTLDSLREDGRVTVLSRAAGENIYPRLRSLPAAYRQLILCSDPQLLAQVRHWMTLGQTEHVPVPIGHRALAVVVTPRGAAEWPLGIDRRSLSLAQSARLVPVIRMSNPENLRPQTITAMMRAARDAGAKAVLFQDQVTGYSTLLRHTVISLQENGLSVVSLEGDASLGLDDVVQRSGGFVIRAHTVGLVETERQPPGETVDRYVRAARERNVRLLLVRLPRQFKGDGVTSSKVQTLAFVRRIASETVQETSWWSSLRPHLRLGPAKPQGNYPTLAALRFPGPLPGNLLLVIARFGAALGVLGAWLLILEIYADLTTSQRRYVIATGFIAASLLSTSVNLGSRLLALGATSAFPLLAILWGGSPTCFATSRRVSPSTLASVLLTSAAISVSGGFIVAALLNDWTYWTRARDFSGTKFAGIFPLLLLVIALAGEFWPARVQSEGAAPAWRRARERLTGLQTQPFTLSWFLGASLAVLVVSLWLARSGNDSGIAVSPLEWRFRALLEQWFVARPRTKEFLLCHPAFILATAFAATGRKKLAAALLLLGAIGQTGILNSFAQANNPLYIPLWRSILGVILALPVGLALAWLFRLVPGPGRLLRNRTAWRVAAAGAGCLLVMWLVREISLRRRYAELTAIGPTVRWPWPATRHETLTRGVEHWVSLSPDGTSQDLLSFDFAANPLLRLQLWDQDTADSNPGDDRVGYWNRGPGVVGQALNKNGDLLAAWNGTFFGLTNQKPREADRSFHLAPVVIDGEAHYKSRNHRWAWGFKARQGRPQFRLMYLPGPAAMAREFDFGTGAFQALLIDGHLLQLKPYPWFGEPPATPPVPSSPSEAGHIPVLDHIRTSRTGAGWSAAGRLYVLTVKEPDGEAPSRAQLASRKSGTGGWSLAEHQAFWESLPKNWNVRDAVGLDGGDAAQLIYRHPSGQFTLLPPRLAIPAGSAAIRLETAPDFSGPIAALHGGALNYFVVREAAPNTLLPTVKNRGNKPSKP